MARVPARLLHAAAAPAFAAVRAAAAGRAAYVVGVVAAHHAGVAFACAVGWTDRTVVAAGFVGVDAVEDAAVVAADAIAWTGATLVAALEVGPVVTTGAAIAAQAIGAAGAVLRACAVGVVATGSVIAG